MLCSFSIPPAQKVRYRPDRSSARAYDRARRRLSPNGERWISCRPNFFLPVLVLSRLFRRLFLEKLAAAHDAGLLRFFGELIYLADADAFAAYLAPLRKTKWFVYSKRPFAGPEAVLAYLSRYTHRVAISNRRLISADDKSVTFKWKDYRVEGHDRYKTMTLATSEFIRRFLTHVLPKGLHRIRHFGPFANGSRAENVVRARELLVAPPPSDNKSREGNRNRSRRPIGALAPLPLLRRPHAHHRNLRARQRTPISADVADGRHQDRHIMSGIAQHPPRKAASHPRWPSAGHDGARTNLPCRDRSARQSSPSAASGGGNNPRSCLPIPPMRVLGPFGPRPPPDP
jgi:hypothetical protein